MTRIRIGLQRLLYNRLEMKNKLKVIDREHCTRDNKINFSSLQICLFSVAASLYNKTGYHSSM